MVSENVGGKAHWRSSMGADVLANAEEHWSVAIVVCWAPGIRLEYPHDSSSQAVETQKPQQLAPI